MSGKSGKTLDNARHSARPKRASDAGKNWHGRAMVQGQRPPSLAIDQGTVRREAIFVRLRCWQLVAVRVGG